MIVHSHMLNTHQFIVLKRKLLDKYFKSNAGHYKCQIRSAFRRTHLSCLYFHYEGKERNIQYENMANSSSSSVTADSLATYINGFASISLAMIGLQLFFSLFGLPFDYRFLPLRKYVVIQSSPCKWLHYFVTLVLS